MKGLLSLFTCNFQHCPLEVLCKQKVHSLRSMAVLQNGAWIYDEH